MRVTQVMVAKGFGGAERYFVDLTLALAERGHTVQAICHPQFPKRGLLAGRPNVELLRTKVRGSWDWWARRAIGRALAAFSPQVVHAHLARAAHLGGQAASSLGIPVVVKTHNIVNLKYYRHVDFFLPTTAGQRDYLLRSGIAGERIRIIPNFSRLPLRQAALRQANQPPVFVAYGRHVHKKGFDVLLRAFRCLLDSGRAARLVIAGDGPEHERLRALAAELALPGHVEFTGWCDDVQALLARGDVFVLPSRDEPFGIAVLEAMAAGCPIIATRTQGPLETLDEATAGLVAIDDAGQLAAAMIATLADPAGRSARAQTAQQRFRERYSEDAVVPQIEALYTELAR